MQQPEDFFKNGFPSPVLDGAEIENLQRPVKKEPLVEGQTKSQETIHEVIDKSNQTFVAVVALVSTKCKILNSSQIIQSVLHSEKIFQKSEIKNVAIRQITESSISVFENLCLTTQLQFVCFYDIVRSGGIFAAFYYLRPFFVDQGQDFNPEMVTRKFVLLVEGIRTFQDSLTKVISGQVSLQLENQQITGEGWSEAITRALVFMLLVKYVQNGCFLKDVSQFLTVDFVLPPLNERNSVKKRVSVSIFSNKLRSCLQSSFSPVFIEFNKKYSEKTLLKIFGPFVWAVAAKNNLKGYLFPKLKGYELQGFVSLCQGGFDEEVASISCNELFSSNPMIPAGVKDAIRYHKKVINKRPKNQKKPFTLESLDILR